MRDPGDVCGVSRSLQGRRPCDWARFSVLPAAFVNSLAVPFLTTRMWAAGLGKEEKLSPKREKI